MTFRGEGAGGRGTSRLAALLVLLAARVAAGGGDDCLLRWQVGGAPVGGATGAVTCRDGGSPCDADGTPDGACTFSVALCLDVTRCGAGRVASVRVRGRAAAPLAAAAADLAYPVAGATCTREAAVPVRLGHRLRRRVVLRAEARAGETVDRGRLRLVCERESAGRSGPARAVVVTTDFENGALATVGVGAPHRVARPAAPIHSDAVVRVAGGLVFVVNRLLGDNLEVLDPGRGFAVVLQCSTDPGSNPHDVAVLDAHKAYVTRYNRPELWVVDPAAGGCGGFHIGTIDLAPWADGDGIPEMDQTALVGDRLFVTLERLDSRRGFVPTRQSLVVVIDTTTDRVVTAIPLTGTNPFSDSAGIPREPGTGKLLIAEVGNIFRTGDGGIERVDPFALRAEGFVITERALGGNPTAFVPVSPTKAYAVVETDALTNVLVAFDPSVGVVTRRLLTRTQFLPDIALAPDGTLWVADQGLPAPGLRVFDIHTDRQLTRAAIDVGLPPFDIAFLP